MVATLFVVSAGSLRAQNVDDFRTHQSGNWDNTNTWERWNGTAWVNPAPAIPSSADGAIEILSGDTVTVDVSSTVDQVTVNSGGCITVSVGDTLFVADGADSIDLIVDGTLIDYGTVSPSGRISFENGALFIHRGTAGAGSVPTSTWRTGSTCEIDSSSGSNPSNINSQSFYNFIWNATAQGANGGPNFNDGGVIGGDFTVLSSKSFQFRLTNLSGGQTKTVYINGNVNISGSTAYLTSTGSGADTSAKAVIVVGGNVNMSAGQWSLDNSSNAYAEWKIKGNVNITGGTIQSGSSGWYGRRTLNFNGGGTQTFTVSSPGTIGNATTTFEVSNGTTLDLGFPFTPGAGSAVSLSGGTIVTTSTNLLTIPSTASILGGSSTGYVNGPLAIAVAATYASKTFPIGKGTSYRPITLALNHDAATSTTYTAEVFNSAPSTRTLPSTLKSVSSVRYYHIDKGSGANLSSTLGGTITINYGTDDGVSDSAIVRVAEDTAGSKWINLGGSGTASGNGSITSNAFYALSSDDFVLATADTGAAVSLATVTTTAVTKISTTIATTGGNVTNDGGGAVSDRGVCWNTGGSPTISDNTLSNGSGTGAFTSSLTGLTPGTTYHLRAYATNAAGTAYGSEVVFSTLAAIVPPTVSTNSITSILVTSAVSGGNVSDWGGDSVTARGVCWNTTGTPTTADNFTSDGSDIGSYTSGLAPLVGNTMYYVRAYATNGAGTGYGNQVSFTTATPAPDTTVVVAADGSGNYLTLQAAFDAVPSNYTGHWNIYVKKGTYYEKDTLASGKIDVVLTGEDRDSTIITYDDYADKYGGNGSGNPGTSGSFTIAIDASDFTAKNITFRNTYSPQAGISGTQAVALRANGDRQEYINCKLLGYQDTYYTWGGSGAGRLYLKNCYIQGSVDFIFGRDIAVFDSCTIHVIRNGGTITAASTDATSSYGYVFRNCTITADSTGYDSAPITAFYLGRPWQASPRTVFLHCSEPYNLSPAGWQAWNVTPALYAEYNCFGDGSTTSSRVSWSAQLSSSTADNYKLSNIFAKSSASSSLILYNWTPPDVTAADDLPQIDTPLPVQMASFTATSTENGVVLNWTMSSETWNEGWDVQRASVSSSSKLVWQTIGHVKGAVNSNETTRYSFDDRKALSGSFDYRLKQMDLSGSSAFSNIIRVKIALPLKMGLWSYPNPFNPTATLRIAVPQEGHVSLRIYNSIGQLVATLIDENRSAGVYEESFDGIRLATGVYFARLDIDNRSLVAKLLMMK